MGHWALAQLKKPLAWAYRPHSQVVCWGFTVLCSWCSHLLPWKPSFIGGSRLSTVWPPNGNNTFPQISQIFCSVDGILSRVLVCWNSSFFSSSCYISLFDHFQGMWREKRGEYVGQSLKPEANEVVLDWILKFYHILHYGILFPFSCLPCYFSFFS